MPRLLLLVLLSSSLVPSSHSPSSSTIPSLLLLSSLPLLSLSARLSPRSSLCGGSLDLQTYLFMNQVCEDCFSLFRDTDVYTACRAGCFRSEWFENCMENLLLDQETKDRAVGFLRARAGGDGYSFGPHS